MTDETTSKQLAEIEGQTEDTPATGYTPPEGWRVLAVGERLRDGDVTVRRDGYQYPTERKGGWVGSNQRYIRRIEPQAEPQAEPKAEPVQVREGRWRTRRGDIKNIRPCEPLKGAYYVWPWTDGFTTFQDNGRHLAAVSDNDLVEYLGPIEEQPEPEPDAATIEELRSEVSYVQKLLGTEKRRVAELEELVSSLRAINEAQEKAFDAAGKENTALRNQLAAVKAELASVAADRQQLQVELDAAHQVPTDSPELRQLRADLAEVTQDRDTYRDGYERVLSDLKTIKETTKAETVEAILEWLEPVRATIEAADNVQQTMRADNLACDIIRNLPGILRYVVGLNHPEEIE